MANATGKAGEEYTVQWLKKHGYSILVRNYHSRFGEIDIIARDAQYIVFVEVKTRKSNTMVSSLEAVSQRKQQKILLTAQQYLLCYPSKLQPRFDVAAVTSLGDELFGLKYYSNAFGC